MPKSKFGGIAIEEKPVSKFGGIPVEETEEETRTLFGLPESAAKAVFPTTYKIKKEEISPLKALISAGEALGGIERLTAKLRTDPTTGKKYKMSDPKAAFFRPEMEKVKKAIPDLPYPYDIFTGTGRGIVEILGSMASDPTVVGSIVGKLGRKATEKISKKGSEKAAKEFTEKAGKIIDPEELIESAAPKKKFMARLSQADRSILNEPLKELDTPFKVYAEVAEKAIANPRNPTPLDVAGRKAVKALDAVTARRKVIGEAKGEILEAAKHGTIDVTDIKKQWGDLLNERMSAEVKGKKVINPFNPKNPIKRPDETGMILEIDNIIKNMDDEIFVQEADDIKSALWSIIENVKATQAKPINTITEGIGKELRKNIDNKLDDILGEQFQVVNKKYGKLKNMEQFLSRKVGPLMETEGIEQAERGASLLKSALQSNSDRNTRILFKEIEAITGYDLIKDAKFAEIAMKAVDDPRIKGLLEEVGAIRKMIPGKAGTITELLSEISKKMRKPLIEEARKEAQIEFAERLTPRGRVAIEGVPGISQAILNIIEGKKEKKKHLRAR